MRANPFWNARAYFPNSQPQINIFIWLYFGMLARVFTKNFIYATSQCYLAHEKLKARTHYACVCVKYLRHQ